mmetsp:Transcript_19236/g.48961  ORF Transcript_19236/g.48961 Transcript_19236/m.48961 type:complete len:216 (-) Transcript_19236:511-1158(-)|eukprot:CAMPEP_0202867898 /NCGR_PEP_ID=MMETSP1391-20130828/9704_1 /ASSEMBLY_ACC=CAM_ASM_000867 /TAXON_ID=1034604 /ORGANISM="Chlamydomonas leiostraca, Strain SAG 11-49" /LENGTH=215 /DNA_ID=CAMNT_0049547979 /DNA_START=86 /DNA_END=733 /DNA_ORIENTATION=+
MAVSMRKTAAVSMRTASKPSARVVCHATKPQGVSLNGVLGAAAAATVGSLLSAQLAYAEFRLPPIDSDPNRCERGYTGNTIGQANAVSDKILDLRKCSFKGANLSGKVLAGALLVDTDLSGTNLQEAVLTKAYAESANLAGADLTNAVVDRVVFDNANLRGAKLVNTVVTGATFEGADLTDSIWEDALVGNEDVKRLCRNPTLVGESRLQVGCRQ